MQIWEANMTVLQQYIPELWTALADQTVHLQHNITVQCEASRDGNQIDCMITESGPVYLQSQYRPLEEAKRFVKQYEDVKKGSVFLFLGMGNGYILRELVRNENAFYVIYEPSVSYFLYVMEHYDIRDLISNQRVRMYVDGCNANALKHDMYAYVNESNWHLFYLDAMPKYQQIYPDHMRRLVQLYEDSKLHGRQNYIAVIRNTDIEFENMLQNLRYLYRGSVLSCYENVLSKEVPVIIVSAGPSLEKNVLQLSKYRHHAFIICVDTAVPVLLQNQIIPHAVVTADAAKDPKLFENAGEFHVPWFVYTTSQYRALQQIDPDQLVFVSSICEYGGYLYRKLGSDLRELVNGGSVATVAVSVAQKLGSRTIILIGQDLALTDDKVHAGEEVESEHTGNLVYVKGYYGGTVLSREDFKAYLDWYEAYADRRKDITFVNATEGGAYIDGMHHMSLSEAMERYGLSEFDGDAVLERVAAFMTDERRRILLKEYHVLADYFTQVDQAVDSAVTWMQKGIAILDRGELSNVQLGQVEKHMNHFLTLYNSYEGHAVIELLLGREIQEALIDLDFANEDPVAELKRLYTKMHTFFCGVKRAVTMAIPILNQVLLELES